jgi:glycosyltransferase involved in cell wall biosynthesis
MRSEQGSRSVRKIALITWGSGGGAFPSIVRSLASGLVGRGIDVDIVYLEGPRGVRIADAGVREVRLGVRARLSVPRLIGYFRKARPDVAIVTPSHIAPFALIAGRITHSRVVPWVPAFLGREIGQLGRNGPPRMLPSFLRWTYRFAFGVLAVSSDVGASVRDVVPAGIHVEVLPNTYEPMAAQRSAIPPRPPFSILAVGRLVPSKGFDVLIDALGRLERRGVRFDATILGEGPERARLEAMIEEEQLRDRVTLPGHVSAVGDFLAHADVLVHPARYEGFGLVVVEALSAGVPVVATRAPGGPKEILADGAFGSLVEVDRPDSLADALSVVLTDRDLWRALSSGGYHRAEEYRSEAVAGRLVDVIERDLSCAGSSQQIDLGTFATDAAVTKDDS